MKIDKKWEFQSWVFPRYPIRLDRKGENYFLVFFFGEIPIDPYHGEKIANILTERYNKETIKFKRSLHFKWIRFWYLRKHKNGKNKR